MFNSSVEIDNNNLIIIKCEMGNLVYSLKKIENLDNEEIKLVITIETEDSLADFYKMNLQNHENLHLTIQLSMSVVNKLKFEELNKKYLLKNISMHNGTAIFNLYHMGTVPSIVVLNNWKIYNRFLNEPHNDWQPVYNVLNESLVLSKNLTKELNEAILEKKKNKKEIRKIKNIVSEM